MSSTAITGPSGHTGTTELAAEAAALEVAACDAATTAAIDDTHADGAAELLIEAASRWRLAGDLDRCRDLLTKVITAGGSTACYARAELVNALLHGDDAEAATAELAALANDPALTEGPCQLVAELLTDHGALPAALEWYDRAVRFWRHERRAAATEAPTGRPTADQLLLQQRQRVRKRLGL
jgi:hypothetical protein